LEPSTRDGGDVPRFLEVVGRQPRWVLLKKRKNKNRKRKGGRRAEKGGKGGRRERGLFGCNDFFWA
jgi:hypothetical protein